jgi:type I restriction enzyme S subunit
MKLVKLVEVCRVVSGATPKRINAEYWGGTIPWVTPKEISKLGIPYLNDSIEKITESGFKSCSTEMLPAGSLLLSSRAPIGLLAINKKRVCTNQGFKSLVPSDQVIVEYLYYYLKSNVAALQAKGNGATFKELSKASVEDFKILLPPLDDQKRIAHLLGKVEGLIARRKQHLQQLDDLLKSVFMEMFGDPVRNEKGWDIQPCEKAVLDISSGTSYGGEDRAFVSPDEVGVLKISAVTKGIFDPTEFKVVNPAQIKKALRFVKRGDFLFSRANTVELVAACCVIPQDFPQLFLPDKLWALTLNQGMVNPQFFNYLLKNGRYRDVVRSLASGGHDSMLNISMKKFMTLSIPCPLINFQNQFASIVEKVEGLKSHYRQSLADLEHLYGALSQKAFKGELDLSRVPLPVEATTEGTDSTEENRETRETDKTFELLASADLVALKSPEGRKALLGEWLTAWLKQLGDAPFTVQPFMEAARQRLWELAEDEAPDWGAAEYDELKAWIFEALENGRLTQSYDDANNRVQLKTARP